ncbi:MAG: hypothetical protein ACLQIB_34540 [Isosphaeraceae bacterium]
MIAPPGAILPETLQAALGCVHWYGPETQLTQVLTPAHFTLGDQHASRRRQARAAHDLKRIVRSEVDS